MYMCYSNRILHLLTEVSEAFAGSCLRMFTVELNFGAGPPATETICLASTGASHPSDWLELALTKSIISPPESCASGICYAGAKFVLLCCHCRRDEEPSSGTLLAETPLGLAPISFQNCLFALSMCRPRLTTQTLSMPILKRNCRGKDRRPRRWTQGTYLCYGRRGRSSQGHRDFCVRKIAVRHFSSSHGQQLCAAMRRRII